MLYEANALAQIAEETRAKLNEIESKNMRNYADNILGEKLHGIAGVGQTTYRIETNKIPCNVGLLITYLREHGYRAVVDVISNMLVISW